MNQPIPDSDHLLLAKEAADNRAKTAERQAANNAHRAVLAESRALAMERHAAEAREKMRATAEELQARLWQETRRAELAEALATERLGHILAMETSLSWKITRPLRRLKALLAELRSRRGATPGRAGPPAIPENVTEVAEAPAAAPEMPPETPAAANADEAPQTEMERQEGGALIIATAWSQPDDGMSTLELCQLLAGHRHVTVWLLTGPEATPAALPENVEVLYQPAGYADAAPVVEALTSRRRHDFAIMNGVKATPVLPALAGAYVPIVSLIQETAPYRLSPYTYQEVMYWSNHTVFTCRTTKAHAHTWWPYVLENVTSCLTLPVPEEDRVDPPPAAAASIGQILPADRDAATRIVAGAGPLQYRHGADLFVEAAAWLLKHHQHETKIQFVWFAACTAGNADERYAADVSEQIRKLGCGKHITIVTQPVCASAVFSRVDALLFTARDEVRLDLPVNALRASLPVVCFDAATPLADFLKEHGLKDACVAPYLDTAAAAQKLEALLRPENLHDAAIERCAEAARQAFRTEDYARRLDTLGLQARHENTQEAQDAETLLHARAYVPEFIDPDYDPADPATSVRRYLRGWKTGLVLRKPRPGFHPAIYREAQLAGKSDIDPYVHYLRSGSPEGPWNFRVIRAGDPGPEAAPAGRVALHIHAYYPELLADILERLARNRLRPELFISVKDADARQAVLAELKAYDGQVVAVEVVPNTGRDIGPLLTAFGTRLCADYTLIGHVHTKQSLHVSDRATVEQWRCFLLENLLGGPQGGAMADTIVNAMQADPNLAIVFPDDPTPFGWDTNLATAEAVARRMRIPALPAHFNFPVGTMFWIRGDMLQPFVDLGLDWHAYPAEPLNTDGTLLHALERLFGAAPRAAGRECAVTWVPGVAR